jgi:Zn-dependent protease with chaperone function
MRMSATWSLNVASVLLESSLLACAIAAAIAVILALGRVRPGGVRHAAWASVVVAMLLMPVLGRVLPAVDVPVSGPLSTFDLKPFAPNVAELPLGLPVAPTISVPAPLVNGSARVSSVPPSRPAGWAWSTATLALYFIVMAVLLLRLTAGWFRARRLALSATPVALPDGRRAAESSLLASPLTIGIVRPRIVLPASWRAWPERTLSAILAHESAHVRRRDPLVSFIAHVNRCVFWFNPIAWWLERALTANAEHACDEAGVRAMGETRRYADVLLDLAATVRRHRGRVNWQGVGVDGSGLLGRRIDRILRGDAFGAVPRWQTAAIAVACAAVIGGVAACRQQVPQPLREDPEVAAQMAAQKKTEESYRSAQSMTREQVDALESALVANPTDFEGWRKLKIFYQSSGQKVFGWDEMVARRRPHVLWLIDNHPEEDVAVWPLSPTADSAGYAAARAHWTARAARPDATAQVLSNAASFLSQYDAPLAEGLLIRAKTVDPEARTLRTAPRYPQAYWSSRIGDLYGRVILGPTSPKDGSPLTRLDSEPFARDVRAKLAQSGEAVLLASAGAALMRVYNDPDRQALAKELMARALGIDPTLELTRRQLVGLQQRESSQARQRALWLKQAELAGAEILEKVRVGQRLTDDEQQQLRAREYEAIASLPEAERLVALASLADSAYMRAESLQHTGKDAQPSWDTSRKAAEEALRLAPRLRESPDYGTALYEANLVLGAHMLRAGDTQGAVRHLREASMAPPSEALAAGAFGGLDSRLVNYLLKAGERAAVADFLERAAELRRYDRDRLLKDAASVRAGRMPLSYQYLVAREQTR